MCFLCVVQRWSRRVATMLPWLVIPLIVLWALSQLLPPAFRFEITSPRLACLFVLLATLFWYEILMPHLSSWRACRAARLRERRRMEALELQKLRKTATRRCRNCHMPYRDQNPGGGRFMCSYCGHISKRPALDLPDQTEDSCMIVDVIAKNGWLCYADGNDNWSASDSKHRNWSDRRCAAEKSCFGVICLARKLLSCFSCGVKWFCGIFFRLGSSRENGLFDSDHRGLSGEGENGASFQESRGEKARRKAEEKRQARLEKEMLEEEERKQREEVARLVEERRKLRDEVLAAEAEESKGSNLDEDRVRKKEMDTRRRDRRKDRDKASSKSNSDGEELEKRASLESERKAEFEKKVENEPRNSQKGVVDNYNSHSLDGVGGSKVSMNNSRYFERVKGSFLSSSRGFTSPLFGRSMQNSAAVAKTVKPAAGIIDHCQNSGNRRDAHSTVHVAGKSSSTAGDKASDTNISKLAATNVQQKTIVSKKSWQQLFTRSSTVSSCSDTNFTDLVNQSGQLTDQGDHPSKKDFLPNYSTADSQVDYGKSFPCTVFTPKSNSFIGNNIFPSVHDTSFSLEERPLRSMSEDADLFEDPCYDPDPILLLGPVSESLDKFPLGLETGYTARNKTERSSFIKNGLTSTDVNKPSPIEPPFSKLHLPGGMHSASDQVFFSPKSNTSCNKQQQSTWQMWDSPFTQEGPGLIGRPSSWFSHLAQNNSHQKDFPHSLSQKPKIPFSQSNNTLAGIPLLHSHIGNHEQNYGTNNPFGSSFNNNGIWQHNSFYSPSRVDGDERLLPLDLMANISQNEATVYSSPIKPTDVHPFNTHSTNSWHMNDIDWDGSEGAGNLMMNPSPPVWAADGGGGLFSSGP